MNKNAQLFTNESYGQEAKSCPRTWAENRRDGAERAVPLMIAKKERPTMKGEPMSQKPSFPLMKRGDIQSQKEKSHTEAIYPEISPSVSGETAKVFANAIERLFYSDSFHVGKAVLPRANVRSRLWDLDAVIPQSVAVMLCLRFFHQKQW